MTPGKWILGAIVVGAAGAAGAALYTWLAGVAHPHVAPWMPGVKPIAVYVPLGHLSAVSGETPQAALTTLGVDVLVRVIVDAAPWDPVVSSVWRGRTVSAVTTAGEVPLPTMPVSFDKNDVARAVYA